MKKCIQKMGYRKHMKPDIALVKNTYSIRWDPRTNVLSSFIIPWYWVIGLGSLYLDHSLATFPGSFVSIPNMILCVCRTRSLMNEIKLVTVRKGLSSVDSDSMFRIFHWLCQTCYGCEEWVVGCRDY